MAKFCRYCGAPCNEGAAFCRNCGRQLPMTQDTEVRNNNANTTAPVGICRVCGTPLKEGVAFCKKCGTKIQPEAGRSGQQGSKPQGWQRPQAQQQTWQAQPVKPRGGSAAKPVIALVLVAALFISFVYPGYVRTRFFGGDGENVRQERQDRKQSGKQSGTLRAEEDAPPMIEGHSKAISIEPAEGIRISAEENALDRDREFQVKELSAERLLELDEDCTERGELMLSAVDLDAGLASDEMLPGYYNVEMDLSAYGIPEEMYDAVRVTRIDDDGKRFVYNTDFDGKTVRFKSRQNSVVLTSILSAVLAGIAGTYLYKEVTQDTSYYKGKTLMLENTDHFTVFFAAEDLTGKGAPGEFVERAKELQARSEALEREIAEQYPLDPEAVQRNPGKVREVLEQRTQAFVEAIKKDREYLSRRKVLQESYPEELKRILSYLEKARTYLGSAEQGLRLPSYKMKIYLRLSADGAEANTHKVLFDDPAMTVAIGQIYEGLDAGPTGEGRFREDRLEALLCSISHEMTHACQYEYYSSGISELLSASLKLVEATACVTEVQAFRYFAKKGDLPALAGLSIEELSAEKGLESSGALTNRDYPIWYAMPLNEPAPKTGGSYIGYALAYFLDYLNEEHEKPGKTADIMNIYSAGMSFSKAMMEAYDIDAQVFQLDFMDFMRKSRDEGAAHKDIIGNAFTGDQEYFGTYSFSRAEGKLLYQEERGSLAGSSWRFNDAFMKMHRLNLADGVGRDGKKALLIVPDPDNDADGDRAAAAADPAHGLFELRFATAADEIPTESEYLLDEVKNILWIGEMKDQTYWVSEIMGLADGWFASRVAFDAIVLTPPPEPEIYRDNPREGIVSFVLDDDKNPFYKNDYVKEQMDEFGICIRRKGEEDPGKMQFFKAELVGTAVELPQGDVVLDLSDLDSLVSCAYFKLNGRYYFGPESEREESMFGTYEVEVTVKENSSALDSLVGSMPGQFGDYKDLYKDANREMIGKPQKATLMVMNNGMQGAPIGGIGQPIGGSAFGDYGMGNEIVAILSYVSDQPVSIDPANSYDAAMQSPPLVYQYKGIIPPDQMPEEGSTKDKKRRGKNIVKVHLEYDDSMSGGLYGTQYPTTVSGPLELEFLQDGAGNYTVIGESKFGYGDEMKKYPELAALNVKMWFTLEGKKMDLTAPAP